MSSITSEAEERLCQAIDPGVKVPYAGSRILYRPVLRWELRRGERAHRVIVVPLRVELPVWPEGTKQLGHFDVVDDG